MVDEQRGRAAHGAGWLRAMLEGATAQESTTEHRAVSAAE